MSRGQKERARRIRKKINGLVSGDLPEASSLREMTNRCAHEARRFITGGTPNEMSSDEVIELFRTSTTSDWIRSEEEIEEYGHRRCLLVSLRRQKDAYELRYGYQTIAYVSSIEANITTIITPLVSKIVDIREI